MPCGLRQRPDLVPGDISDATVRAAFARTVVPIALMADDRRVVELNDAAAALIGAGRRHLVGTTIDELLVGSSEALERCWARFLAAGTCTNEITLQRYAGTPIKVSFNATANVAPAVHIAVFTWGPSTRRVDGAGRSLSPRQREVLAALAGGGTGEEIAEQLLITPQTVRRHVANARARLDARSRAHAVAKALRAGEIS